MNTNCAPRPYAVSANRLFTLADALFGDRPAPETQGWVPPVDVTETETHYELAAELPGVNATEVKVVVRDGVLSLNGERPALPAVENIKAHLAERRFGASSAASACPRTPTENGVRADFKNGVLTISVPKREEVKPREVEIRIA